MSSFKYNSDNKNKKAEYESLINIYLKIKETLSTGINFTNYNPKIHEDLYIIEADFINKLKNVLKNQNRNNKIIFNEKIKIINNIDVLQNTICSGKEIGFIDNNFINIYNKTIKKDYININDLGPPYELYIGYGKNLVYINDNCILLIIYIKNIQSNKHIKKYYLSRFNNQRKRTKKEALIKTILDTNINKIIRGTHDEKNYINLIEIKIVNEEKKIDYSNNSVNQNNYTKSNPAINSTFTNNLENKTDNTKHQSISNQFINNYDYNNNQIEESIKESIPNYKESITINPILPQINNSQNIIPENIPQKKEIIEEKINKIENLPKINELILQKEKEEEKSINYENEKLKILYEKQIGESFLNDLLKTNEIQLHENRQKLIQIENELSKISKSLNEISNKINILNNKIAKYNKYIINPNKLDNDKKITKEQIKKRREIDKNLYSGRISEIKDQIEELLRQKNILEKALNQKIKEKTEIFYEINRLENDIQQGKNNKYNREMLEKNREKTEQFDEIINKRKEDLRTLENKMKNRELLNAEEIYRKKQEEFLKKKQKKVEEEKEKEENEKIEEEKRQKLEEEKKSEKIKERENHIQKEKNDFYIKERLLTEKRLNERRKEIKEQTEEKRKELNQELEDNRNEFNKFKEKQIKEENEENIRKKKEEKNEIEWNKEIEESNKREKINDFKIKKKLSEIAEEEHIEEDKEQNEFIKKKEEEELIKKREEELRKKREDELLKKKEEEEKEKIRLEQEKKIKLEKEMLEKKKQEEEEIKKREEKKRQEEIKEQIEKEKEMERIKKLKEEEKLKQEEIRKQKEKEEKIKQEQIKKMKELEEKKKNQKEKEQKELEEKIKKQKELEEQQKKKQKELEELQKKKQKELKEQQKKKQKELEQLKLKQKAEEELLKQQKQNQDQNQQIIPPKQSITCKSINPPPLIGLQNIGSTCYMNATLQCFSHTEVLTDYFLNENNHTKIINNNISKKNPNLLQLSPSYLNLIKNLWLSHQKYFSPYAFRKNLAEMNPLFKELSANDAKDLLNYLLTQLHEELNLYVEKNIDEENDLNFNPYNEQMVLQNFVQSFFGKNKSVLSDHFFGIQESKFLCMGCEKKNLGNNLPIKFSFQTFNFLFLPLEEVRKYKNQKNMMNNMNMNNNMFQFNNGNNNIIINNIIIQNNMNNPNSVNIYDCFEYLQKDEIFSGDNAMWCNICNGLIPCKNKTVIYTGPNILILILNRGSGIQYKVKLDFYEKINLDNFIIKKDKPNMIYELYGVVTHLGESGESGHFVAACKIPCNNKWYRFNDAIVTPINDIQSEIINFGMSYILFYKKC